MSESDNTKKKWGLILVKQCVRVAVIAAVIWGINRTYRDASDSLQEQQQALQEQVQAGEEELRLLDEADGPAAQREELRSRLESLRSQRFSPWSVRVPWLLLAGLFYSIGMLPNWLFWRLTLRALGARPTWIESARAFFVGHLGKYVPGKAMVVVLRTSLVRSERTGAAVAAVAVFIETLTMMAVGAMMASLVLVFFWSQWQMLLISLALVVAAGVPTLPPVFRVVVRILKVKKADPEIDRALQGLDFPLMLRGWSMIAFGWLLFGMSLWATIRAIPIVEQPLLESLGQVPLLTACVALAMVLGFLSLIPGGLLVREWVVMTLVAPQVGAVAALASAVWLRLVWLVSELLISTILYFGFAPFCKAPSDAPTGPASLPTADQGDAMGSDGEAPNTSSMSNIDPPQASST